MSLFEPSLGLLIAFNWAIDELLKMSNGRETVEKLNKIDVSDYFSQNNRYFLVLFPSNTKKKPFALGFSLGTIIAVNGAIYELLKMSNG